MASAKFLIPFSLLVAVGTHIGSFKETTVNPSAVLLTVQNIGQPFSSRNLGQHVLATTAMPVSSVSRVLPVFLLAIWCSGCFYVLFRWWSRLRRIRSVIREA